jgi:hypothetical protein
LGRGYNREKEEEVKKKGADAWNTNRRCYLSKSRSRRIEEEETRLEERRRKKTGHTQNMSLLTFQ